MNNDIVHIQLRKGTIHMISDGVNAGYVNLMTQTAFVLPVDGMEHCLRLSKVARQKEELDKEKK